jgi:hypothetical protein
MNSDGQVTPEPSQRSLRERGQGVGAVYLPPSRVKPSQCELSARTCVCMRVKKEFTGGNVSDHTAAPDLTAELHDCAVGGD